MQFDWIFYPVTQYCVIGAGLISSLWLWISAKAELRAMHHGMTKSIEILDQGVRTLSTGIDEIRSARETAVESTPVPLGQALNLTKRTQVLRMHRRGETTHSIAAALQLPLGEVVLLLKIERLLDSEQAVASPPLSRSASAG